VVRREAFAHIPEVLIEGNAYPNYVAIADGYVDAVLAGKVLENRLVILACERYRAMREVAGKGKAEYGWYPEHVIEVCAFIETCDGGEHGNEPIQLEPFQCWMLANLFGFRVKDAKGTYRWFTEWLFDAPRSSGKTGLVARIDLYCFLFEHERASQVLLAASSRPQAMRAFKPIYNILRSEPELVEDFGLKVTAKSIRKPDGGFIDTLSAIGRKEDGAIPHIIHIDELHAVNDALFDVITSSFGKRRNELLLQTTTAGVKVSGPAYAQRKRLERVLTGQEKAPRFFGVIYTIDEADMKEPLRYENVVKAHPMFGVTIKERAVLDDMEAARFNPGRKGEFLAKRLNVYTRGASHAIAPNEWASCESPGLKLEDYKGRTAFIGVDLSSHDDQTALAVIIEDGDHLVCFAEHFIPESSPGLLDETIADDLHQWVEAGHIKVTDLPFVDYAAVQARIEELCEILDVEAVVFDRAHSIQMAGNLLQKGIKAGIIQANNVEMSEPTKDIVVRARSGMLKHDGNPVLAWNAANMVIIGGTHSEFYRPAKDKTAPQRKIDGLSALCHANVARLGRVKAGKMPKDEKPLNPRIRTFS
jgi:phage terminase large subunit-like protein